MFTFSFVKKGSILLQFTGHRERDAADGAVKCSFG